MKRLVLILFVLMLPLQSMWAAASVYCQHGAEQNTQHWGHHEHQHRATEQGDTREEFGGERLSALPDSNCSVCHLGHCSFFDSGHPLTLSDSVPPQRAATSLRKASSSLPRPERPKWAVLA